MAFSFFQKLFGGRQAQTEQQTDSIPEETTREEGILSELESQPLKVEFEKINVRDDKARLA